MDAIRAAFDQVAQLVDGVVDAGIVQAGRVVLIAGNHAGEVRRQAGRGQPTVRSIWLRLTMGMTAKPRRAA